MGKRSYKLKNPKLFTKPNPNKRTKTVGLQNKDKCLEFQSIWFTNNGLQIILFLMKNNKEYYTREEIAKNSIIKKSTLQRYLPKLEKSKYNLIISRITYGTKFKANNVKEYHINPESPIIALLNLILEIITQMKEKN